MAYDPVTQQVVLFGGNGSPTGNDTWLWDGVSWIQKFPVNSPPQFPPDAVMAWDDQYERGILLVSPSISGLTQTWAWDGTNWTQMFPLNSPPSRDLGAMVYDSLHRQIVLFGGFIVNGSTLNDTWIWDGTNWTQQSPAKSPPMRWGHSMAYDSAHGQVVLFGGNNNGTVLHDTWTWDGTNWTQQFPAMDPPVAELSGMANIGPAGLTVLRDSTDSSTWVWDGTNWVQQFPSASPPPRLNERMVYDASRAQIVLFGGQSQGGVDFNDTWVWNQPLAGTGAIAEYLGADTTTLGNWPGVYGLDGKYIPAYYYGAPSYSSFTVIDGNERLYTYTTTDHRAVEEPNGDARIESYWDTISTESFQVTTTDNQLHEIALYFCDYTFSGRSVTVKAISTTTGVVLSSLVLNNYSEGVYLVFLYQGPVTFQVTDNNSPASGLTATVNAFFWGGNAPSAPPFSVSLNPVSSPVSGTVLLTASASSSVVKVQFYLDGNPLSGFVMGSQFLYSWDTTTTLNGPHQLTVTGYDASNNSVTSGIVNVKVSNVVPLSITINPVASPASGTVLLTATTGPSVVHVQYYLDGNILGPLLSYPFSYSWDTTTASNGPHQLTVTAYDASNNSVTSGIVNVTVNNAIPGSGNWTQLFPSVSPTAENSSAMTFDNTRGQLVQFGGAGSYGNYGTDTFTWDGNQWTHRSPAHTPPGRYNGAMASDSQGHVVLFGGEGQNNTLLMDTWFWDGTDWTQVFPNTVPPARYGQAMVYDQHTGQLILFGGYGANGPVNDMWIWNGLDWASIVGPTGNPPARYGHGMVYDAARDQVVLFGGEDASLNKLGDTWVWNGAAWTQVYPVGPSPRVGPGMAYDALSRVTVLFGGFVNGGLAADTWTWDGTNWTQLAPSAAPSKRVSPTMAYDAATGQVLLTGGIGQAAEDTWVWNQPSPDSAFAEFLGLDTTTLGNWHGVYGADGVYIPAYYYGSPSYSSLILDGANERLYNYTTTDVRALQEVGAAGLTQRIESYWDSTSTMTFQVNTSDNQPHHIEMYLCDYTNSGRSALVQVIDTVTGTILDTQLVASAQGGVYLRYNYQGNVTFVVNNTAYSPFLTTEVMAFFWN